VVAGTEAGGKLDKAQELGINIMNESQFIDFLRKIENKDET
jgi:NAD-dependent DNA ligase